MLLTQPKTQALSSFQLWWELNDLVTEVCGADGAGIQPGEALEHGEHGALLQRSGLLRIAKCKFMKQGPGYSSKCHCIQLFIVSKDLVGSALELQ